MQVRKSCTAIICSNCSKWNSFAEIEFKSPFHIHYEWITQIIVSPHAGSNFFIERSSDELDNRFALFSRTFHAIGLQKLVHNLVQKNREA